MHAISNTECMYLTTPFLLVFPLGRMGVTVSLVSELLRMSGGFAGKCRLKGSGTSRVVKRIIHKRINMFKDIAGNESKTTSMCLYF